MADEDPNEIISDITTRATISNATYLFLLQSVGEAAVLGGLYCLSELCVQNAYPDDRQVVRTLADKTAAAAYVIHNISEKVARIRINSRQLLETAAATNSLVPNRGPAVRFAGPGAPLASAIRYKCGDVCSSLSFTCGSEGKVLPAINRLLDLVSAIPTETRGGILRAIRRHGRVYVACSIAEKTLSGAVIALALDGRWGALTMPFMGGIASFIAKCQYYMFEMEDNLFHDIANLVSNELSAVGLAADRFSEAFQAFEQAMGRFVATTVLWDIAGSRIPAGGANAAGVV